MTVAQTHRVNMDRFRAELSRLAELTFDRYGLDITTRIYLHGRRVNGIFAELNVLAECPDGWETIWPDHVPRSMSRESLAEWFRQILKREPLWLFTN